MKSRKSNSFLVTTSLQFSENREICVAKYGHFKLSRKFHVKGS